MYTYVALTTNGHGYWVVTVGEPGNTPEEVRAMAAVFLRNAGTPREAENIVVLSRSAAIRAFPAAWRNYQFIEAVGMPH